MDEFRVEVVNVAEEAERLKEAAKEAAKSKDKEGDEKEADIHPGIPCHIQVWWILVTVINPTKSNPSHPIPTQPNPADTYYCAAVLMLLSQ